MKVWIVGGWFGDVEWIEDVYLDEAKAEERVAELRKTRSGKGPDYTRGLQKFSADAYEVIE